MGLLSELIGNQHPPPTRDMFAPSLFEWAIFSSRAESPYSFLSTELPNLPIWGARWRVVARILPCRFRSLTSVGLQVCCCVFIAPGHANHVLVLPIQMLANGSPK